MAIETNYNIIAYTADTVGEVNDIVFAENALVTVKSTGVIKKGNGKDKFSALPEFGGGGDVDLSDYAKLTDLEDYAKTSDLSDYATSSALSALEARVTALEEA